MGKRNHRTGKGFTPKNAKAVSDNRGWTEVVRENEKWEAYYKSLGIIPSSEWDTFKSHCQTDLPLTFRVTGLKKHAGEVNTKFIDEHVSKLQHAEHEGMKLAPKNIAFVPNGLGWQMDVPKSVIRKNARFSKTQRFLVLETTVGNILRQEAVSMIPPLLMDVQPHHKVLDMCAAPGLKTAQLVEALHFNDPEPSGYVIANDADYKRLHMLVHQVKRLNSPNLLVVNHDAQLFPRIQLRPGQPHVRFDRILCDVPCSGDGTMRKNINVWKDFTVGDALGLHPLQVNILVRGLHLLKDGGRLVYSTCLMLPVENEAVVAEALRRFPGVEVVDVSGELPELVRRPGISQWKVFGKDMQERTVAEDKIHALVFPPTQEEAAKFHLERCVRVYPHLQNTGGFFITVLKKTGVEKSPNDDKPEKAQKDESDSDAGEPEKKKQKTDQEDFQKPFMAKSKKVRTANEEPFIFLDPQNPQLQKCWQFYDVNENFPRGTQLVRNATGEACRLIYHVHPAIAEILKIEAQKLKLIHAGIKIFSAQRNDNGMCPWRAQNEAMSIMKPYLGPARKLTTNMDMLKTLLQDAFPPISQLGESGLDPEFILKLQALDEGCVFLTVERGSDLEDVFLPVWKGRNNVNLMVNKHDTQELLMRLYDIETSAGDDGKEKIYQMKVEARKREEAELDLKNTEAEQSSKSTDAETDLNAAQGTE